MVNLCACPALPGLGGGGGGATLTGARARIVEMSNSEAAICKRHPQYIVGYKRLSERTNRQFKSWVDESEKAILTTQT